MGVIGCDPCPEELASLKESAEAKAKPGWFKRAKPLAGVGTYAFLGTTRHWSAEQICLAYALTEPSLASVQVAISGRKHLTELAGVSRPRPARRRSAPRSRCRASRPSRRPAKAPHAAPLDRGGPGP